MTKAEEVCGPRSAAREKRGRGRKPGALTFLAADCEPRTWLALLRKPHAARRLASPPPHFLFILIQIVATTIATNISTMMMRMESVRFLVESLL
jgi:hypothetical protein